MKALLVVAFVLCSAAVVLAFAGFCTHGCTTTYNWDTAGSGFYHGFGSITPANGGPVTVGVRIECYPYWFYLTRNEWLHEDGGGGASVEVVAGDGYTVVASGWVEVDASGSVLGSGGWVLEGVPCNQLDLEIY